ncbi:MAG TPA: ATP-binding protein [Alphaproteobacteria bacterium]|nr:ATP-binding protein [Alphaproteobacteria bacterium]
MASGDYPYSFALFDAKGRLVDWDEGFEQEFRYAAAILRPGLTYAEILRAAVDTPEVREFLETNFNNPDPQAVVQTRLAEFGKNWGHEYRQVGGRLILVDEQTTANGGICRFSRDITEEREAEDALAKARWQLDAAESDAQGVFVEIRRNPDGSYVFPPISDGIRRLLNFPPESVGFDPMMVHTRMRASADDDARIGAVLEQSAQTLEICTFEYSVRDGNDALRWVRQSMIPRREADGTVIFSGVMRDVTREKEAEDQVALLQSVVVRSSDAMGIFETSADGAETKIVYVNDTFVRFFGGSAETLVGQPIDILNHNDINGDGRALIMGALERDDGVPVEYETGGRGGRIFWVEARVETVQKFEDGRTLWIIISRDVSERHRAQAELMRAKDEAEAGSRAKTNFLANMSHELRTQLNAIIGFSELIAHGVARTGWTPGYAEYLGDVSASGRHLLELINSILDLTKIETGSLDLNLAPIALQDLVQESLSLVSGMARDGNIVLSAQIPADCPEIPGDFLKLKQVLLNVLSNAVKFTPPGGRISVSVSFDDDFATITVADTGCGISKADLMRVLHPFVQAENSLSRRHQGSGLGLSIAQEFCNLHNGSLTIDSVESQGTTVRIALPRR